MIIIIEGRSTRHEALQNSMFADRKALFVGLLGWDLDVVDGVHEIDRYDHARAIYVIVADEAGRHQASLRLLPTDEPHLMADLYPGLCVGELPFGRSVHEVTRLCLPNRHDATERRRLRVMLFSATIGYCLSAGIDRLIGFTEASFRRELLAMGWKCEMLGPTSACTPRLGAFSILLEPDTPERMAWADAHADTDWTVVAEAAA